MSKAELLEKIQAGWDEMHTYLDSLSNGQKLYPTDAAGWTVKDHVMHLAAWEDGLTALLDKQYRRTYMGIDDAIWNAGDDAINAVIQQRYKDLSWADVQDKWQAVHNKLLKQIDALSEATLQTPYSAYNPKSPSQREIIGYIGGSTYYHYAEHLPWIKAIVVDRTPLTKSQLLTKIQNGWDDLNRFLASLSDEQKTQPIDAAGWSVKDHMIHLAVWENGVVALLNKHDRVAQMGVDKETWDSDDDDRINAIIRKQHQSDSLEAVEQQRQTIHRQLIQQVDSMSDDDLQRPMSDFDSQTKWNNTISGPIIGNTYMHYGDHMAWMEAIAAGGAR
jgi:hypothetical protein